MARRFAALAFAYIFFGGFFAVSSASAEKIYVDHSGNDIVGELLAYEISRAIDLDPGLTIGSEGDTGWKIILMTSEHNGVSTFSVTLVRKDFDRPFDSFVTTFLGGCGLNRVKSCAQDVFQRLRVPIQEYTENWPELQELDQTDDRVEIGD